MKGEDAIRVAMVAKRFAVQSRRDKRVKRGQHAMRLPVRHKTRHTRIESEQCATFTHEIQVRQHDPARDCEDHAMQNRIS